LKRLYSLALHPSSAKRFGAAMAMNQMYRIFREHDDLIDQFTLEILVVFLRVGFLFFPFLLMTQ
jgi:hypothetical protein